MARRIVVFPVMGRRWAFSAVLPTSSEGKNVPVGSIQNLWENFRSTPQNSDRVELVSEFVSDKMYQKFTAWGATPEGSIRNRGVNVQRDSRKVDLEPKVPELTDGQRLLSRLCPTESLLKAIHKDTGLVEIVYPDSISSRLVRRRVRHLAMSGEIVHRRYMYGSVALLPFSVLMGILPLPNVFLAWNLFRAYSHWRALQGSKRLCYLITEPSARSDGTEAEKQGDKTNNSTSNRTWKTDTKETHYWVLLPSVKLDSLLSPLNSSREPINEGIVAEICKEYPLDPLEILKWRDHKLPIKSFG
ncbi:hypothetical protein R1flu_010091 [Riccia fluitans]|uniref:Mitochondrial K+-H+ exchange-related protein n=1 Tax=Riccia fluitans TaxID=41844 RepID=A0ABD1Z537_9MARC